MRERGASKPKGKEPCYNPPFDTTRKLLGANGFDGVVNLGTRAEVPEASLNNRQNTEANTELALAA